MPQPIKGRTFLLFAAGLAALLVVAGTLVFVSRDYDVTIAQALRQNQVLVQMVEEHARRTFDTNRAALKEARALIDVGETIRVPPGTRSRLRLWVDDVRSVYAFWIIDQAGRLVFTTLDGVDPGAGLAVDRPFFQAHANGAELFVNGMTKGRFSGQWFFSLSQRLTDANGNFRGVLMATTRSDYFASLYGRLNLGAEHNMAVYKPDGTVIARRLGNWEGDVAPSGAGHPVFTTYLPHQPEGTYQAKSPIDGHYRLGAYRTVQGWPLVVTSVSERSQVLEPWRSRTIYAAAYCLAVLAGVVVAALWGLRRIAAVEREREATLNALIQADLANRAKTSFLATISHEFRTPLNAIIGFSDGILHGVLNLKCDGRCNDYIRDIHGAGVHLLSLINDVLDLSAIEAGKLTLHPEVVPTAEAVQTVVALIKPRSLAKGLTLEIDLERAPSFMVVDMRRFKQILLNLLGNAVKFTQDGGIIRLSIAVRPEGGVALVVADNGIGMDSDGIATALTQFGQVDNVMTRRYEGTGLGLPLSKALAEQHGGTLTVASAEGQGTTVTVLLPPNCVGEEGSS
ncbi:MAG: ATP-binding protein [Actinomycetota bacterium]